MMRSRTGQPRACEIALQGIIHKSGQGRVQKVFCNQRAKVSQESFVPPKASFAPVQPHLAPVQAAFCLAGCKRPMLHPLLTITTFVSVPFFRRFARSVASNVQLNKVQLSSSRVSKSRPHVAGEDILRNKQKQQRIMTIIIILIIHILLISYSSYDSYSSCFLAVNLNVNC